MEQLRDTTKNRFSDIVKALKVPELTGVPCFLNKGDKWFAAEELILLSALQTFGYGNWKVIADTLTRVCKKYFTALEVQMHYNDVYLEGEIGKAIRVCGIPPLKNSLVDHTVEEDDELVNSSDMKADLNVPEEFLEKIGYMPLREDFVVECKFSAENILKEVRFKENMEDFDKTSNMLMLDAYRETVKERIIEKKMIRALRLVEKYYKLYSFKKNKKPPKSKLKFYSQNLKRFLQGREKYELPNYFELFFKMLPKDNFKNWSKCSTECSGISSSLIASMFSDKLKNEFYEELFAHNNFLAFKRKENIKKEENDAECNYLVGEIHHRIPRRSPRNHSGSTKPTAPELKAESRRIASFRRNLHSIVKRKNNSFSSGSSTDRGSCEKYSEFSFSNGDFDINSRLIYLYPCVEYLTREERSLCQKLNLQPLFFIYYKTFLIKEDLLRRAGQQTSLCMIPEGLKIRDAVYIYNFLKQTNWIKSVFEEFSGNRIIL